MIPQLPKQNKYYFDQTVYPNAEALARQAQGLFPSIRFGVGSSVANANFNGDESVILAALSLPAPPQPIKAPIKAPMHSDVSHVREKNADIGRFVPTPKPENSAPTEPLIEYKEGDIVLVTSLGIEGKIKSVLPSGIVNVELADGITETMLAKNLEPMQPRATNTANENVPPAANENTPPASTKASTDASVPPEAQNEELRET